MPKNQVIFRNIYYIYIWRWLNLLKLILPAMNTKKTNTPKTHFVTKSDRAITTLTIVYVVLICAFMISHRIWFSPDQFFVFAFLGAVIIGRALQFLIDWGPFVSFYLAYEFLRGFIPFVSKNVHIFPMIKIDNLIFGSNLTVKLQSLLYNPVNLHWYDYVAVTFYVSHFVAPMIVGLILWTKDRKLFKIFALGFLILSYSAFITYLIFPAMPPWMASSFGYLPPIKEVTGVVMSHFLTSFNLPSIYSLMNADPVAAMPSLHAAFPFFVLLFAIKKWKKLGLLLLPYVLSVWFAVIYLGEHYFIDVLMGVLYATGAFIITQKKDYLAAKFTKFYNLLKMKFRVATNI